MDDRNPNTAADPGRIERHRLIVAPDPKIDIRRAELQIAQHDFVEKSWQPGIAQPDFVRERIEFETKRGLQERKRARGGPGLRRTGDWIERRTMAMLALVLRSTLVSILLQRGHFLPSATVGVN